MNGSVLDTKSPNTLLLRLILWQDNYISLLSLNLYFRNNDIIDCRRAAMSVNTEFQYVDKFVSELGGSLLVVTDSWIIKCNVHTVNIIHQRDAVLKLV